MANNPKLYNQKDIQPIKERYKDVNKTEIKLLGKVWADIEYNGETTKLSLLIPRRNDITPLLGLNWLKELPIAIKNSIGRTHQPVKRKPHKIPQAV